LGKLFHKRLALNFTHLLLQKPRRVRTWFEEVSQRGE